MKFSLAALDAKIAEARATLDALVRTRALFTDEATAKKVNGQASILADALALDTTRRARTKPKNQQPGYSAAANRIARRAATQRLLASFATGDPRTSAEAGIDATQAKSIGSAIRHGYLRKTKRGYVRTAKDFTP